MSSGIQVGKPSNIINGNALLITATGSTTARTAGARAADLVNLLDNGCVCDGVTNDYAALAALVARLGATAKTIVVPGPCKVNTAITLPQHWRIRFEGDGHFMGPVSYSGMAFLPPEASNAFPLRSMFAFSAYAAAAQSDPNYGYDDIYHFTYNRDPANGDAAFSADEPQWTEQIESRYIPGAPTTHKFEKHWTYTAIDRGTTYRPFNFDVNLTTHKAIFTWLTQNFTVAAPETQQTPVFSVWTESPNEYVKVSMGGIDRLNVGALGNIMFRSETDLGLYGYNAAAASAGATTKQGPYFASVGAYWNGSASVLAQTWQRCEVLGNNVFSVALGVGSYAWRFKNTGRFEMVTGMYLRMQAPDNSWWKVSMANGGTLAISAD
jgi:hypothetical protein